MVSHKDVSILVPAYNEEDSIGLLLERIHAFSDDFEIVVCSDGSTDKTAEIARSMGAVTVEHVYNLGNGASVRSAAKAATREYFVVLDADLQHPPEEIDNLLEFLPKYDLIIGARTSKSDTETIRNVGNAVLNLTAETLSGHKIQDLTSGFRAMTRDLYFRFEHLYPLRYSYPSTITIASLLTGAFVKFVPIDSICKREKGNSNIRVINEGIRFMSIILRIVMTFKPEKVFLPISLFFLTIGVIVAILQLSYSGGIHSTAVICIIVGIFFFLNGLLAAQLSNINLSLSRIRSNKDDRDEKG